MEGVGVGVGLTPKDGETLAVGVTDGVREIVGVTGGVGVGVGVYCVAQAEQSAYSDLGGAQVNKSLVVVAVENISIQPLSKV